MTDDEPEDAMIEEIEFRGRTMFVHAPTPGQIVVWERIFTRLSETNEGWNGAQVVKALGQIRSVVDSILASPEDSEWLDMQMLDNKILMEDLSEVFEKAMIAYHKMGEGNREERRAAGKATPKKASRKKG